MKNTFLVFCLLSSVVSAQVTHTFSSGFNPQECDELLVLNEGFADTTKAWKFRTSVPGYQFLYRSKSLGLDNVWDLWVRDDSTVVITLRGTTPDQKSLLANAYCAMMPTKGIIKLTKTTSFDYKIAEHEQAAVHGGFLAGFAYLANDARPKIDSLYHAGYRNYIISGHSQGGAIAFCFSSWLYYLGKDNIYPAIKVKTYTSAAPKMGNMYFVYNYDNIMGHEWAFSVTNSSDPVPEMPFTTQQLLSDMNEPNPFVGLKKSLKSRPFIERVFLKSAVNNMRKKAEKSAKSYQKYLRKYSGKFLNGMVPDLEFPEPINSTYFLRPGVPISLIPSKEEAGNTANFHHHLISTYRLLLSKSFENK